MQNAAQKSALIVTIHALLLARQRVQEDRETVFRSAVNMESGMVDDRADATLIASYDKTLATIDEAIERAKQMPDITTRDYFAAEVMTECIRVAADQTPGDGDLRLSKLLDKAAVYAYRAADAMLKARSA